MKRLQDLTVPELSVLMTAMGKQIEMIARQRGVEKPMFALVLFNDPKISQYIGNCQREDMIEALRETAERLANRQDVPR